MAREETKCMFVEQAGTLMQRAAEEALSVIFFVGFEEAYIGFENASQKLIEDVSTKSQQKRSLEDTLEWTLERQAPSSLFMNTFTQRTVHSSRFVWPAAIFRNKSKDQFEKIKKGEKNWQYVDTTETPFISVEIFERKDIPQTCQAHPW